MWTEGRDASTPLVTLAPTLAGCHSPPIDNDRGASCSDLLAVARWLVIDAALPHAAEPRWRSEWQGHGKYHEAHGKYAAPSARMAAAREPTLSHARVADQRRQLFNEVWALGETP